MTQLSNFLQSASSIYTTLTAGENIASGDLVSVYPNGQAYWATPSNFSTTALSSSLSSGVLRPFRASSAGFKDGLSGNVTGSFFKTFQATVPYLCFAKALLSNGNTVFAWVDNTTLYVTFTVLDPSGAIVVAKTQIGSGGLTTSNAHPIDVCSIPGGGFGITWSANGGSTLYVASYSNAGVQTLAPTTKTVTSNTVCKIAAISTGGFVIVYGQAGSGNAVPMTAAGVFGTVNSTVFAAANVYGGTESNKLVVLSNGNFGWVAQGSSVISAGTFSATTSTITPIYTNTSVPGTSTNATVDAASDGAGGFYFFTSYTSGTMVHHITSAGSYYGSGAMTGGMQNGSAKLVVNGSICYAIYSDYSTSYLKVYAWSDSGSAFTQKWIYNLQQSQNTNQGGYTSIDAILVGTNLNIIFQCGSAATTIMSSYGLYKLTVNANSGSGTLSNLIAPFSIYVTPVILPPSVNTPDGTSSIYTCLIIPNGTLDSSNNYSLYVGSVATVAPIGVATAI